MTALLPPVIDLKKDSEEEILSKVRSACLAHGFFVITNHGADFSVVEKTRSVMKDFFCLPQKEKEKFPIQIKGPFCHGYVPCGGEKSDVANSSLVEGQPLNPRDLMESFQLCDPALHPEQSMKEGPMREQLEFQYAEFTGVMGKVLGLLEKALDLPEGWLKEKHDLTKTHRTLLRVTHYPPLKDFGLQWTPETATDSQGNPTMLRIGEHRDLGTVTVLACDDQGGLEVSVEKEDGSSEWVTVPLVEQSLVINSGLCLYRLTNQRVKASVHRVVANEKSNTNSRYSVILFGNGNEDARLLSHPNFGEAAERKYEDASFGQYLACKLIQIFEKDASQNKGKCRFDD